MASCLKNGLDHGVGHPWLPLGPRRSTAAPQARGVQRLSRDAEGSQGAETVSEAYAPLLGFRMGGAMEGYLLWAVATSAGPPIVYGCFRPIAGELPKGAYKFIGAPQWPTR